MNLLLLSTLFFTAGNRHFSHEFLSFIKKTKINRKQDQNEKFNETENRRHISLFLLYLFSVL